MEEEDLVIRSTKKVKTHEGEEEKGGSDSTGPIDMEEEDADQASNMVKGQEVLIKQVPAKKSYRDSVVADGLGSDLSSEDIVNIVTEEYSTVDMMEDLLEEPAPFDPKPKVEVSLEEYDEWCKPWKFSLIVKLLGKKLGFQAMATWVRKVWAKRNEVKVLDLTDEFFLVRFADEGDYKHALFEGPWMVVDHYLLVQRWRPLFKPSDKAIQKLVV